MKEQTKIVSIITKIIEDNKAVREFIRGEKSINDLHKRGIKFAKPI